MPNLDLQENNWFQPNTVPLPIFAVQYSCRGQNWSKLQQCSCSYKIFRKSCKSVRICNQFLKIVLFLYSLMCRLHFSPLFFLPMSALSLFALSLVSLQFEFFIEFLRVLLKFLSNSFIVFHPERFRWRKKRKARRRPHRARLSQPYRLQLQVQSLQICRLQPLRLESILPHSRRTICRWLKGGNWMNSGRRIQNIADSPRPQANRSSKSALHSSRFVNELSAEWLFSLNFSKLDPPKKVVLRGKEHVLLISRNDVLFLYVDRVLRSLVLTISCSLRMENNVGTKLKWHQYIEIRY